MSSRVQNVPSVSVAELHILAKKFSLCLPDCLFAGDRRLHAIEGAVLARRSLLGIRRLVRCA